MGIVTTYICDVSGKQGVDKSEFIAVRINSTAFNSNGTALSGGYGNTPEVNKFIHKDVAIKLGLYKISSKDEPVPEVTFESKLTTLLKDYISELVYDEVQSAVSN